MQFLVPLFLVGSIALAVPIFLHLTRKNVNRPVEFPSLMFLQRTPVRELRKRRLRQLPLLLLRCLAILCLVGAFAQPVLNSEWLSEPGSRESRSVLLLVDNSLSASREEVWREVLEAVRDEIQALDDGDEAAVVQFGETSEIVWNWDKRRQPLISAARDRLRTSFAGTSYQAGLRTAADLLLEASNARKELYLITDLQASGLSATDRKGIVIPSATRLRVKDVGGSSRNSYIDQVRIGREVFQAQYPYAVQIEVVTDPPVEGSKEVALYLEGEVIDRRTCELGSDGKGTVHFDPFALSAGITRGRISLDADDSVTADDTFHFVLERRNPFVVTLIQKKGSAPPYFEEALSSGRNLSFRVNSVSKISKLNVIDSPVVVLDNTPVPPSADQLLPYLESGGGVIVCPGKDANASEYNRMLQQLLPVVLKDREFARGRKLPFFKIEEANWEHAVLARTREAMEEVRFYGYWAFETAPGAQVIARFDTGAPALVEASVGKGRILVFAASLGRVWSDFPVSNAYLPFWQTVVQYAADWSRQPSSLNVNQVLAQGDSGAKQQTETGGWEVLDPKGRRLFSLEGGSPDNVQLSIPGHYEVRRDRLTDWVAVNTDRKESDLSRVDSAEMMAVLEALRMEGVEKREIVSDESPRQSLWGPLLMIALALLIVEAVLAGGLIRGSKMMRQGT